MKFTTVLAGLALGVAAMPTEEAPVDNELDATMFEGLDLLEVQQKYAKLIIAQAKKENVGRHGCQTGIATALTESTLIMHANPVVPESLAYPHERLGYDGDSVGLFQQRATYYTDIKCSMDAKCSAHQFYAVMKKIPDWQNIPVGVLCQKVQISAIPEAYNKFVVQAESICAAAGM